MHAERLFSIIKNIINSYDQDQTTSLLDNLITAVNSRISNPGDRQFDEQISSTSHKLFEALDKSEMRAFSVTWRKIIEELNLSVLLPEEVRSSVEKAFENRLVDSDLLKALQHLQQQLQAKLNGLSQLRDGFTAVEIGDDDLGPGQVEFDVMMPRESINDQLTGFNKELSSLNKEMQVIASITKTPEQLFKINSVSTNDFTVALNIDLNLGEVIAAILFSLAVIRNSYQSNVDKINQLEELPTEIFDRIKEWANTHVKQQISQLIERLPAECPESIDPEALANKKVLLQNALEYFAQAQDRGFNMDVRAGLLETDSADEEDQSKLDEIETANTRLRVLTEKISHMKMIERQTKPILSLTEENSTE